MELANYWISKYRVPLKSKSQCEQKIYRKEEIHFSIILKSTLPFIQRLNTIFLWNCHHLWQRAVSSAGKQPAKPSEEVLTSKQFLYHSHIWIRHKKECLWVNMCVSVLSHRGWLVQRGPCNWDRSDYWHLHPLAGLWAVICLLNGTQEPLHFTWHQCQMPFWVARYVLVVLIRRAPDQFW